MKKEDYERLKKIVEENGFEMLNTSKNDNEKFAVITFKKDIWEGVEFSENIDSGNIYPCNRTINYRNLCKWRPSTEQAYIEQLKKEAFELFGEIKKGDRFDRSEMCFVEPQLISSIHDDISRYSYEKQHDQFWIGDLCLYNKGKWAKKVERVKVEFVDDSFDDYGDFEDHGFVFRVPKNKLIPVPGAGQFLAKQLENYLNEKEQ